MKERYSLLAEVKNINYPLTSLKVMDNFTSLLDNQNKKDVFQEFENPIDWIKDPKDPSLVNEIERLLNIPIPNFKKFQEMVNEGVKTKEDLEEVIKKNKEKIKILYEKVKSIKDISSIWSLLKRILFVDEPLFEQNIKSIARRFLLLTKGERKALLIILLNKAKDDSVVAPYIYQILSKKYYDKTYEKPRHKYIRENFMKFIPDDTIRGEIIELLRIKLEDPNQFELKYEINPAKIDVVFVDEILLRSNYIDNYSRWSNIFSPEVKELLRIGSTRWDHNMIKTIRIVFTNGKHVDHDYAFIPTNRTKPLLAHPENNAGPKGSKYYSWGHDTSVAIQGASRVLDFAAVPSYAGVSHFLQKADGFIYPIGKDGKTYFSIYVTPNLIWVKTIILAMIEGSLKSFQIMKLAADFGKIYGLYSNTGTK